MKRLCAGLTLATIAVSSASAATGAATARKATASPAVYPVEEGFVDGNGVFLYYKIVGRGEPLVVLHGGPGASHVDRLPALHVPTLVTVGDYDECEPALYVAAVDGFLHGAGKAGKVVLVPAAGR
ncbi:MAG TPA: hypothetical protein VGR07_05550 [Thermoanaerobaculia bacterium]|jgi:pimeloyl-ACP methyl ester carboxylesterase|nr:hypothetical protein [Thermoanaerobaculia bacterium]